jgi:hypothetical protein
MSEEYKIYVAKSPQANLYLINILSFLRGNKNWMDSANPTVEEVQKQIIFANDRKSRWTNDMNEADIWDSYSISQYHQYLPEIEFLEVSLGSEPIKKSTSKPKM